jgi:hypothetical protein
MGQYHKVCNLDKKEFLHPHEFGDGLKLLEFGASGNGTMLGLAVLLSTSNGRGGGDLNVMGGNPREVKEQEERIAKVAGRWAGDRIAVVGDYADKGNPKEFAEAYHGEENGYTDISKIVIAALTCDRYFKEGLEQSPRFQRAAPTPPKKMPKEVSR